MAIPAFIIYQGTRGRNRRFTRPRVSSSFNKLENSLRISTVTGKTGVELRMR